MARQKTRPNQPEVRLAVVIKTFAICLLIGFVAIGYVLQSHENLRLRREASRLERQLEELRSHRRSLENQLGLLQMPSNIEHMVVAHGLDLVRARPSQLVTLGLPSPPSPMVAQRFYPSVDATGSGRVP